jgi:hypothetical protein
MVWFEKFIYILMKWNLRCYFLKMAELFYSVAELWAILARKFEKSWQH